MNDGRTFRGYGAGSRLTLRLDLAASPGGWEFRAVRPRRGFGRGREGLWTTAA